MVGTTSPKAVKRAAAGSARTLTASAAKETRTRPTAGAAASTKTRSRDGPQEVAELKERQRAPAMRTTPAMEAGSRRAIAGRQQAQVALLIVI